MMEKLNIDGLGKVILVASGKGGVGKSTVAANLALSLSAQGKKTALLDADIFGPSVPVMFGLENTAAQIIEREGKQLIRPVNKFGIDILSIGFFVNGKDALIWRGPMASNTLTQLLETTDWQENEFLVIDLPPGTSDIQLTIIQKLHIAGSLLVTTPQNVALADVRKAANMFLKEDINVPVFGVIENMSYFVPASHPDEKYFLFGEGGGNAIAKELGIELLGQIPIVKDICDAGDLGKPEYLNQNEIVKSVFDKISLQIINQCN
ncbi:MAG: hypothetical protein C0594_09940 [Marinilabiliales bacterium]|nr:MAG: hypothetical protein C0594_09940 [Marinilabiliales bacterium]